MDLIVPCHGYYVKFLPSLVKELNNQMYKKFRIIIAVSEISDLESGKLWLGLEEISDYEIVVLGTPYKKSPGANRNRGALYSDAKYLVFMDSDDLPKPDFLMVYRELYRKYDVEGIFSSHKEEKGDDLVTIHEELIKQKGRYGKFGMYNVMHNCLTCKREVFDCIRYDRSFKAGEDVRFGMKLLNSYDTLNINRVLVTRYERGTRVL